MEKIEKGLWFFTKHGGQPARIWKLCYTRKPLQCVGCKQTIRIGAAVFRPITNASDRQDRLHNKTECVENYEHGTSD